MTLLEIVKNWLKPSKKRRKRDETMKRNFWWKQSRDERGRFKP